MDVNFTGTPTAIDDVPLVSFSSLSPPSLFPPSPFQSSVVIVPVPPIIVTPLPTPLPTQSLPPFLPNTLTSINSPILVVNDDPPVKLS